MQCIAWGKREKNNIVLAVFVVCIMLRKAVTQNYFRGYGYPKTHLRDGSGSSFNNIDSFAVLQEKSLAVSEGINTLAGIDTSLQTKIISAGENRKQKAGRPAKHDKKTKASGRILGPEALLNFRNSVLIPNPDFPNEHIVQEESGQLENFLDEKTGRTISHAPNPVEVCQSKKVCK